MPCQHGYESPHHHGRLGELGAGTRLVAAGTHACAARPPARPACPPARVQGKRFAEVTKDWRTAQATVRRHCRASELTRHTGLALLLGGLSSKLELVAKGVMDYLDVKRAGFPRFYFLGNAEMVDMMVSAGDPVAVEPYLPKCFPGVYRLQFSADWGTRVEGLISSEGEALGAAGRGGWGAIRSSLAQPDMRVQVSG